MGKARQARRDTRFGRDKPSGKKGPGDGPSRASRTKHALFADGAHGGAGADAAADGGAAAAKPARKPAPRKPGAGKPGKPGAPKPGAPKRKPAPPAGAGADGRPSKRARPPPAEGGAGGGTAGPRQKAAVVRAVLPLWETLRSSRTEEAEKLRLVSEALGAMDDVLAAVCAKHDAARVVQACIKHGSDEHRAQVLRALSAHMLELCRSQYGHHVALALLRHGPKGGRQAVAGALLPHTPELLTHRFGCAVLEHAYADVAPSQLRQRMYAQLWGREFRLFGAAAEGGGAESVRALPATSAAERQRRAAVLSQLADVCTRCADKGTLGTALALRACCEVLLLGSAAQRAELVPPLLGAAPPVLHTPHGATAVARAIVLAGPKERKALVRALKGLVRKAAEELYGCAVLCALCDNTDDTVLLAKSVLSELSGALGELALHAHGHRLLLALLPPEAQHAPARARAAERGAPCTPEGGGADEADTWLARRLPPELRPVAQARLELRASAAAEAAADAAAGVGASAPPAALGGKKDAPTRRAELRAALRAPLLAEVAARAAELVGHRTGSLVVEQALSTLHAPNPREPDAPGCADGAWAEAAAAVLGAAFEPTQLKGEGAGKGAGKKKGAKAAEAESLTHVPRFAADATVGRVLKRLCQGNDASARAFGALALERARALRAPCGGLCHAAAHGGAWVCLALLEAEGTAEGAAALLRGGAAGKGGAALLAGASGPGCAALCRALDEAA